MSRTPGSPKSGGRVKGSLDKAKRQLVSEELGYSILATFEMLGGTAAMVEWARENQTVFYTQILSRLMPPALKEDPDIQVNTQINFPGSLNPDVEAGRRIAFALAKAMAIQGELSPQDLPVRLPGESDTDLETRAWKAPRWKEPTPVQTEPSLTSEELAEQARQAEHQRIEEARVWGGGKEQGISRKRHPLI